MSADSDRIFALRRLLRAVARPSSPPHFPGNGGNADDAFYDGVSEGIAVGRAGLAVEIEALLSEAGHAWAKGKKR